MRLNVINARGDRRDNLLKELKSQNITDYELWDGVFIPSIKASINAAHKQIVEYAKLAEWEEVCIAEDDLKATHPNSWNYFLQNKPADYDLYLSMIYLGQPDENNIVKDFTGLTLYCIHSRFYDKFLSVDPNEHIDHLDRALRGLGKFVVCNPFTFIQYNGRSSNTGKHEEYDSLLIGRNLYNG